MKYWRIDLSDMQTENHRRRELFWGALKMI